MIERENDEGEQTFVSKGIGNLYSSIFLTEKSYGDGIESKVEWNVDDEESSSSSETSSFSCIHQVDRRSLFNK